MNGQDLLNGLTDIDDKYVEEAETEAVKTAGPRAWLRWGALAACVCLIAAVALWDPFETVFTTQSPGDHTPNGTWPENGPLTGNHAEPPDGAPNEAGNEEAVVSPEPADYAVSVQYIRSDLQNGGYPSAGQTVSPAELEQYDSSPKITELITSRAELERYCAGLEEYDDSYFKDNNLLLITLEEPSGSIRHRVVGFWMDPETAEWTVTVERTVPANCTDDMALWQILISVQMGAVVQEGDGIHVQFVTQVEEE